jgi:quinol monooxygenase YgiN
VITLTVNLDVRPGHLEAFLVAIEENALRSVIDEPGCLSFDVAQAVGDEHHFVFHEVYASHDAVEAHRAAPHFAAWREVADTCVVPGSQVNVLAHRLFHHG